MAKDFYAVLALPRNATEDQIRQRFRELARNRHPDRFHGAVEKARAEVDFQEVTQAFNVLSNAEQRRRHDLELTQEAAGGGGSDQKQLVRVYLQRGIKAYREKSYLEAADNFDRATLADPNNAQAWHHLAQACSQQENWLPRAISAIERACELEPMNPAYLKQAGRIFSLVGQTERALNFYRRAIEWGGEDAAVRQAIDTLSRGSRRSFFGKSS